LKQKSLNLDSSVEWLKAGKILIHPTESIWGLGCDAFNEDAVASIFKIKNRDKNKSFILLIKSLESFKNYLQDISKKDIKYLHEHWPGPYTFLIKYNDKLPEHLRNNTNKIALRVSNHLPVTSLFKSFSGFMISTSANISGQKNLKEPEEIINYFEYDEMAFYDELLGTNSSPSTIIDLETKAVIRA
tara:strand:- start:923 stop:1483 length:561 start_codon:yes stop_codon:yes gene_type:complete